MNELTKTSIFLLLAATLVAGAFLSRPTARDFQPEEMLGTILFPQFTNPLDIKSLEIVRLDAVGRRNDFRIVEVNGIWSIPSHENYPADARDQMGRVAEALTDLKVLDVIQPESSGTDSIDFQTQYGVIDPTSDHATFGEGVGIKITLNGADNETLVDLIVGKSVAQRQPQDMIDEESGLRYVRIANQAPVYVVSVDPSQFSTNFDQWIEKNLLDISTFDIKEFFVDQYSLSIEPTRTALGIQLALVPSFIGDITLGYDAAGVGAEKWSLIRWMKFEQHNSDYKDQQLGQGRELDTDTLDAMVSALNDLRIVSVLKKPAGFAAALREGTPFEDIEVDESIENSMEETGFWLVPLPDLKGGTEGTKTQLLSNDGDLQLRLKDGIVYHLRFGDLTGTASEMAADEDSPDTTPVMGVNRYLFITAEFDPAIIPPPELREIPTADLADDSDLAGTPVEEIEMLERMNQREQERYDAALERGRSRALELSDRFADWYYVISEDVYRKIHLTESNVFRFRIPDVDDFGSVWDGSIPGLPVLETPVSVEHLLDLPAVDFEFE